MSSLKSHIKSQPSRPMREWADEFGISRPHLIALLEGQRMPSLDVARRIQAETKGAVPVRSWPNIRKLLDDVEAAS